MTTVALETLREPPTNWMSPPNSAVDVAWYPTDGRLGGSGFGIEL
jgi:hypothetical protein